MKTRAAILAGALFAAGTGAGVGVDMAIKGHNDTKAATSEASETGSGIIPGGRNPLEELAPHGGQEGAPTVQPQAPYAPGTQPQPAQSTQPGAHDSVAACSAKTAAEIKRAEQMLELLLPDAQDAFNKEMPERYEVSRLDFTALHVPQSDELSATCMPNQEATKEDHPAVVGHTVWARKTGTEWAITPVVTDDGMPCTTVAALATARACDAGWNAGNECDVMTGIPMGMNSELPGGIPTMVAESVWQTCQRNEEELLRKTATAQAPAATTDSHSGLVASTLEDGDSGFVSEEQAKTFTGTGTISVNFRGEPGLLHGTFEDGKIKEATIGDLTIKGSKGGLVSFDASATNDMLLGSEDTLEITGKSGTNTWHFEGSYDESYDGVLYLGGDETADVSIKGKFRLNDNSVMEIDGDDVFTLTQKNAPGITVQGGRGDLVLLPTGSLFEIPSGKTVTVAYENGNSLIGRNFSTDTWMPKDGGYKLSGVDGADKVNVTLQIKNGETVTITEYKRTSWGKTDTNGYTLQKVPGINAYQKQIPEWNDDYSSTITFWMEPNGPSLQQTFEERKKQEGAAL